MSFQLPNLSYNHDALEPHIDSKTMQIHHGKHHAGYTNKLNAAIEGTDLEGKSIEEILKNLDMNNSAVRNNGGGYYNHCLFWEIIGPNCGGSPSGKLADAINKDFGSFDEFKSKFSAAAATRFGSGWASRKSPARPTAMPALAKSKTCLRRPPEAVSPASRHWRACVTSKISGRLPHVRFITPNPSMSTTRLS